MEDLLVINNVEHWYSTRRGKAVPGLGPISLNVAQSEFLGIVGPSGCGKTTLLRLVSGLRQPASGEVHYKGELVTRPVDDVGIAFQHPVLLEWRTVISNVMLQAKMRDLGSVAEVHSMAEQLLRSVGLEGFEDRYPWELSGGQQQRVSLCRALIHRPGLLLMDEPFGALDALTREQLQVDVERLWMMEQPTVLFVTHDVGEAVSLADRVIIIRGHPGVIVGDVSIDIPHPRAAKLLETKKLQQYALEVRTCLGNS